ncbi:MAG: outer membrane beta-barrel protein, partial [Thermodesulfobacteriota bacterium]
MRNQTILRLYRAVSHASAILLLIALSCSSAAAAVTFYPRLSVETSYTDNVDLVPDNEEHDFITTISPGFDLGLTGRKHEATLSYTPSWALYSRFSENNEMRHNASLAAMQEITRSTRVELSNDYVYTEDPAYDTGDPLSEVDTTVRRDREPYQSNSTDVSLIHQFGPEDSIELGYRYYFLKNDDPRYEDSDNQEPRLRITYWPVTNRYGIETEVSYTERSFDDSEDYDDTYSRLRLIHRVSRHLDVYLEYAQEWTNYVDDGVDYKVYNPLAGFTWAASANFSLNGSLGYFVQENDNDEDESGLSGSLETVYS